MKTLFKSAVAVASLCIVASGTPSLASTQDETLRRLEAKLDALAKENAALRNRVNQIEAARQPVAATRSAPVATAAAPAARPVVALVFRVGTPALTPVS